MKRSAPAALRNREAIADMLEHCLPAEGLVLEVASGTGEHAVHFARRFPALLWQPSDPDASALASIAVWREEAAVENLLPAVALDAGAACWPVNRADAIVCINMVHISPWAATLGLLAGAATCLTADAPLVFYGPYRQAGVATAPSNEAFDASLKARDPAWGLRTVGEMSAAAEPWFALHEIVSMPANNLTLLFRRRDGSAA